MPIILPENLPAIDQLRAEGIPVLACDARPMRELRIGLVNLMPDKPATELQLARLLGAAPLVSRLSLFRPPGLPPRRTPSEHMAFYDEMEEIPIRQLDALIITGAPVEHLPFAEVRYWNELAALYANAWAAGLPTLNICWAAMAALHLAHGLDKRMLAVKAFGVFDQTVHDAAAPLMQGLPRRFAVPVSRHALMPARQIADAGVAVLASAPESGSSVAVDEARAATLLFDHLEYDAGTLVGEYRRDRAAGLPTAAPAGLALGGGAEAPWRSTAHLLVRNWLAQVEAKRAGVRRVRQKLAA